MGDLVALLRGGDVAGALAALRGGAVGDVNARGSEGPPPEDGGATALLLALRTFADGDAELVRELLDRGADVNLADTIDGETPIQTAARYRPYDTSFAAMLLDRGADPEKVNKHGDTALHVAASAGSAHVAALLIKRKANYKAKDRKGKTALQIAQHDVGTQSAIEEAIESLKG